MLINGRFDIIETNAAHEEMFWDWHSLPCVHKNLLWCAVTEPRARELFLNYDQEIPHMVARLRAAYAQHIGDPEWEEDIRRLAGLSGEFAELWARHEVAGPCARTLRFRHPAAGPMTFTRTELDVSGAAGPAHRRVQPAGRGHPGPPAPHPPQRAALAAQAGGTLSNWVQPAGVSA